jgi:signal peptidase I
MFKLIKVKGKSLTPAYKEGDYVVITTLPFFAIKRGDTIVFRHNSYGTMIKRVDTINQDTGQIYVTGTHEHSVDSHQFGPILKRDLAGKVICHIRKPTL